MEEPWNLTASVLRTEIAYIKLGFMVYETVNALKLVGVACKTDANLKEWSSLTDIHC